MYSFRIRHSTPQGWKFHSMILSPDPECASSILNLSANHRHHSRQFIDLHAPVSRDRAVDWHGCFGIDISLAVLNIVPDRERRAGVLSRLCIQIGPYFIEEPPHRWEGRDGGAHRCDKLWVDTLDNNIISRHGLLLFDRSQPRFDALQSRLLVFDTPLQLGALHSQDLAHLGRRECAVEQPNRLLQRETQVLKRKNAVEPRKLLGGVVAIAG